VHARVAADARRMAKKKRTKKFSAVAAVKSLARERVGMPPATRRDPDIKKERKEKHKPTLGKMVEQGEDL